MTRATTAAGAFPNAPALISGPGGVLSQGDAGKQLQLGDATMRAHINKTGASNYHLILHPNILPSVTVNVPKNQGTLLQSGCGVVFADVDVGWWSAQIHNLETLVNPPLAVGNQAKEFCSQKPQPATLPPTTCTPLATPMASSKSSSIQASRNAPNSPGRVAQRSKSAWGFR